jgi:hypothetical protein
VSAKIRHIGFLHITGIIITCNSIAKSSPTKNLSIDAEDFGADSFIVNYHFDG